jgi:hypothetical protein
VKSMEEVKLEVIGNAIDTLITVDFHARGFVRSVYDILRKKIGKPLTYHAAKGLSEALAEKNSVALIGTGFLIAPSLKPETDGPIGAALLARALDLYGAKPIIVAEEGAISCLKAICLAAELNVYEDLEKALEVPHSVGLVSYPVEKDAAQKVSERLINEFKPKAMVTIEHPGQNELGLYHTAFGKQLADWVAPIDILMNDVRKAGGFTVGIGDLGNEAGMGNAKPEIDEVIPYGDKGVATIIESDAPIMSVISEIGTYGLIACLSAVTGQDLLHDERLQELVTRASVLNGAVEGIHGNPKAALDLVDVKYCNYCVGLLHAILQYSEIHSTSRPYCLEFIREKGLAI